MNMDSKTRGDRRERNRHDGPQRRSRPRTPGAFNDACDAAYQAIRKYQIGTDRTKTEVPLHEGME